MHNDVYHVIIIGERGIFASVLVVPVIVWMSICISYHMYDEKDKTKSIIPQRGKSGKSFCWDRRKSRVVI